MEQEQTNVNDNFQVTFDFAKTPITQIADYIIIAASKNNTSDIHFDPRENGMMVRFRIDGDLQDYSYIPKAYERNLTTRLKLLANMNITESRLPQDGAIKGMFGDTYLDMRVSCLPLNEGEKIVIRILDYTRSLQGIDSLGFHPDNLIKLKRMMATPNGIILTTGATGSGKSTTTYSILQGLNTPETNIITVEDPIEMNIQGINQVQVNSEIGMTFAAALRSILRQDPNVILIGEIRDSETAQIAVRSAITGHLVLSTIHTNNSLSTIERLMDMDVERYLLSTALVGIISQRLAKGICPHCRFQRKTTPYEQKIFRNFLRLDVKTIWDANPKGCPNCRKGYKGRIAIQEVLELDDDIRTALNNPKLSKEELKKMVYTDKTITMLQDALIKCINGETNFEEVYRVIEMDNEDDEDYSSELTAAIDEAQNGEALGVDGADILDSLNNAPTQTIEEKPTAQPIPQSEELPNVVNNLQQPEAVQQEPVQQPQQEPVQQSQPEAVQQPQQPVQETVTPEAPQPTDQYTTNPEATRHDDLPEIVQALPVDQNKNNQPAEADVAPETVQQPQPQQSPLPTTTGIENSNKDKPLDVAIVDAPTQTSPTPQQEFVTTAIENTAPNAPLEVAIVGKQEEPLSEEVIEVPIVEKTEETRVVIPTYEEVKAIEEQQRLEEEQRLAEQQKILEEQQKLEEVNNNEEITEVNAEQSEIIQTDDNASMDITNDDNQENKLNDEISIESPDIVNDLKQEEPLSDEIIGIPNVIDDNPMVENIEPQTELSEIYDNNEEIAEANVNQPEIIQSDDNASMDITNEDNQEIKLNDEISIENPDIENDLKQEEPLSDEIIGIPNVMDDNPMVKNIEPQTELSEIYNNNEEITEVNVDQPEIIQSDDDSQENNNEIKLNDEFTSDEPIKIDDSEQPEIIQSDDDSQEDGNEIKLNDEFTSDEPIKIDETDQSEELQTEESIELTENSENNEDDSMFEGNVLVSDDGVEQQEEYSIFDFRNNRPMTFDENEEETITDNIDSQEIQIVPEATEEVQENTDTSEIVETGDNEVENDDNEEIIDAPDPSYDINYTDTETNNSNSNEEDEITRTIQYGDNVVEINDIDYNFDKDQDSTDESVVDTEDNQNAEDINEEYNPDMINHNDSESTQDEPNLISKKDIEDIINEHFDNNDNLDENTVDLSDTIYVDSTEENDDLENRDAIGADFVDENGPLLEELPRLSTEAEEFDENIEFDPEAFE